MRGTAPRRVTGIADNGILLSIQLAAANIAGAISFIRHCDLDEDNLVRRYAPHRRKAGPPVQDWSASRRPSARSVGSKRSHPDNRTDPERGPDNQ